MLNVVGTRSPAGGKGLLVHLCSDASEIVRKPVFRGVSIVASSAYKRTEFAAVDFTVP